MKKILLLALLLLFPIQAMAYEQILIINGTDAATVQRLTNETLKKYPMLKIISITLTSAGAGNNMVYEYAYSVLIRYRVNN